MRHLIQVPKGLYYSIMYFIYLLIIVIIFIYNVSGIYLIIPFLLAIINYIYTSIILIVNPNNLIFRLIQLISLGFIVIVIGLNISWLIWNIFI